jgi:hypothetical protein
MKEWLILRTALIEGGVLVGVCGIFWLAIYAVTWMYGADSFVIWWISNIDVAVVVILSTALALVFLRLVLDAVIAAWKGFLHVIPYAILA